MIVNVFIYSIYNKIGLKKNHIFDFHSVFILLSCHNLKKPLNLLKK